MSRRDPVEGRFGVESVYTDPFVPVQRHDVGILYRNPHNRMNTHHLHEFQLSQTEVRGSVGVLD